MLIAAASLSLLAQGQGSSGQEPPLASLVHVQPAEVEGRPRLLSQLGFDHVGRDPLSGALELAASAEQLVELDLHGVDYEVVVDDLIAWYESHLTGGVEAPPQFGAWLTPSFGSGSMGGYYTFAEITSVLDQIHAAYPALTTAKASLGPSVEGRSLWMLKISDNAGADENEPEMRIDAMHHAREPESMQASLWFVLFLLESYGTDAMAKYLVDSREIFFVPCVNPDGYVYNQTTNPGGGGFWRKNRRNNGGGSFGVDLNRNYNDHWGWDEIGSSSSTGSETYRGPSPASEPEIQAMQAFIQARQFQTALSVHTFGDLWLHPFGYAQVQPANIAQYSEISALATVVNHYTAGGTAYVLYLANGITTDYEHDTKGTLTWTPEIASGGLGGGFWPPTDQIVPLAEENLLAFQRIALAAGAWAHLSKTITEVGDGDGLFEPGESASFALTVRNSGRAACATPVVSTLASASSYATIVNGVHDFGALASFTQGASNASIAISPSTPSGTAIHYTLTLSYEGWNHVESGILPVGPIPVVYCTAKTNSLGCTPEMAWSGYPSASQPDPFVLSASQVVNLKSGLLFYGSTAHAAPFQGGTLCVHPPTRRTPVQDSGGSAFLTDCTGTYSLDFNARIQSGLDPGLVPWSSVFAQYWTRDPASPSTTGLTDAVSFQIWP